MCSEKSPHSINAAKLTSDFKKRIKNALSGTRKEQKNNEPKERETKESEDKEREKPLEQVWQDQLDRAW